MTPLNTATPIMRRALVAQRVRDRIVGVQRRKQT